MIIRKWVTLHILWKAVLLHLFLSWTGSEWHCTFWERLCHHIFFYDQQLVSDIAHFVNSFFPMTNSKWATLHIFFKAVQSSHLCLWLIGGELYCTFCDRLSHHIFFLWPTACEWHCHFFDQHSQQSSIHECLICHYCISESEHVAISFPSFPFTLLPLYIDCKISLQLTYSDHLMWSFLSKLISLFLWFPGELWG